MKSNKIDFTYLYQPPKRYTFEQPKLKKWVERWCFGRTLNLFAGKIKLDIKNGYEIRVDIDENMPVDYHMDAFEFVKNYKGPRFNTIVLDPPYNLRKAREKYNGRYVGSFTKIKYLLPSICALQARLITLGYNSVGMGLKKGFIKIAICLVCHNGDHQDTIGIVEKQIQKDLFYAHD